jgi:hypothetical protein
MRTLNPGDCSKHTRWESQLLMSSVTLRIGNQINREAKHRGNSKGRQRYQKTFLPTQLCLSREPPGSENLWQHARDTIAVETQQGTSGDEFGEPSLLQQELRGRGQLSGENHADSAEPRRQLRELVPCGCSDFQDSPLEVAASMRWRHRAHGNVPGTLRDVTGPIFVHQVHQLSRFRSQRHWYLSLPR